MGSTFMRIMIIVLGTMPHWNCQTHTDVPESRLKPLFFEADLKNNYHQLIEYFNEQELLKQVKGGGWTMYPPLSALAQSESRQTSTIFEFHEYQDLRGLKEGILTVRKIEGQKDANAFVEISLTFNSAEDAETANKTILKRFADFQKTEGPFSPNMQSTIVYDTHDKPVIRVSLLSDKDANYYAVSIYQITSLPN